MAEWYYFAITAAVLHTLFQILRKKALQKSHAMSFESVRGMFVVLLALLLIPFMKWDINPIGVLLAYVVSLLAATGIVLAAKAYHHNDISLISPLSNMRPAFVAILAFVFLSEAITPLQITGIAILLVSAYLLESDHHFSDFIAPIKHLLESKYSLYFLLATFLFSIGVLIDRFVLTTHITNVFTYFFFVWLFIAININIIHALFFGVKDSMQCLKETKYLPFVVALISVSQNLLIYKALTLAYASLVTPVLMLSTLGIVIFGGSYFHEKYLLFRLTASALMLVGAYMIII